MVHLAIENLLSSCTNRPLYEALWFMAFTKNSRPENFENESVEAICNELIARVRQDDINARSFLISTNLAYGTVRLYKTQVDKLYEQVKFALQSCSTAFNHMDWFTQMTQVTSTPIVHPKTPRTQKTVKQTQTTIRRKTAKKTATQPTPKLLDDFDLIESIYNIVDEDEDVFMTTPAPKGRKSAGNDTGIGLDPTMASDVHAITIREPTKTFMTSGYQSMLNYEDDDVFGSKIGDEFQTFLKETEDTIMSQDEIIQETTNLLTTVKSRKRTKIVEESIEIKRRRLTYMNNDESGSVLRNANADQPVPNIDIYQPEVPFEMDEASTFYESLNATEATNRQNQQSMLKSTIDPMDIEEPSIAMTTFNEPTIPNTTFNEESTLHNNTDTLLENMTLNEPTTILDNDATMIPEVHVNDVPMKEPENLPQESEFILDEIPKFVKQNRVRKSRNLITDKQIMMPLDNVKKGIQHYKEKYTGISPFADFHRRMHYYRSCTDVLFSTGSFLLKKSPLHKLYVRNMKKVPEKMLKQQLKENGKQLSEIKNLRRSSRPAIPIYDLKKKLNNDIDEELEDIPQVLDPKDIEMKEIRPTLPVIDDVFVDKENISPDVVRISKRSSRSRKCKKVLKESTNIDVEMQELELPEIQPNLGIEMYKDQQMEELPPALNFENIEINNVVMRDIEAEDKERINRKKVVLKKLASFWKQSDKLITMEKICNGMLRSEAAGTFYELLLLAKRCVVELVHKTDSLEISNILCKISTSQLSKELYN